MTLIIFIYYSENLSISFLRKQHICILFVTGSATLHVCIFYMPLQNSCKILLLASIFNCFTLKMYLNNWSNNMQILWCYKEQLQL